MSERHSNGASLRLAHGWRLAGAPAEVIREFVRPALRAVPGSIAARLGVCRIRLAARLGGADLASQWSQSEAGLEIEVATGGIEGHDVAMELLLCLGQALWERAGPRNREAYLKLLWEEIEAGVCGEIDEEALREKSRLLASRVAASSRRRLEAYARASFAGTVAEYIHCLWHDVTVRSGPDYLPAQRLRRRLELMAKWFPPDRGYRLFPRRRR